MKFSDGTPFTADGVAFSFQRVKTALSSFKLYATDSGTARRIDDYTVEFTTASPNPVETSIVASIFIMSRKWCEKNNAARVIPLHRQVIPWVSRAGVAVVHRPNNMLYLPWVRTFP